MTQGKRLDGNSQLPLPAPRSGAELDRKIIDYARAKAPSPRPPYARRWYAGMATAAVVVAAVLITLPPQVPAPAARSATGLADEADLAPAADMATEAAAPQAAGNSVETFAGKALAPDGPIDREALVQQLERYRALLQTGEQDRARTEYRQLRLDCPNCELPETLEQALFLYPAPE